MTELHADEIALRSGLEAIGPLDQAAMTAASAHLDRLTKPVGSLGRLEELVVHLAGIAGRQDPPVVRRQIVVAAGDHGVTCHGVSAYPSAVTAQMVANFVAGGAAINALAATAGAAVTVIDVGLVSDIPNVPSRPRGGARLIRARIRDGTRDMTLGPAMTRAETLAAIAIGLRIVDDLRNGEGVDILGVGEMGIGNTTAASAIIAALTGEPVVRVTGRGTGIADGTWERKVAVIERALAVNDPDPTDPVGVLAAVGGLEIAVLVGLTIGAAAARVPVVLDGFITAAAALVGVSLRPSLADRLISSHRSTETGHGTALTRLGRRPLLDLELHLGEATGAALAMTLIGAACRLRDEMATFESAAVSGPV